MTSNFHGSLTENSTAALFLLAAHLPRDLRWPMLLTTLTLAVGSWWLRASA